MTHINLRNDRICHSQVIHIDPKTDHEMVLCFYTRVNSFRCHLTKTYRLDSIVWC